MGTLLSQDGSCVKRRNNEYRLRYKGKNQNTFVCRHLSGCSCSAKLIQEKATGIWREEGEHSEECQQKTSGVQGQWSDGTVDLRAAQRAMTLELAEDRDLKANEIFSRVVKEASSSDGAAISLTKTQVSPFFDLLVLIFGFLSFKFGYLTRFSFFYFQITSMVYNKRREINQGDHLLDTESKFMRVGGSKNSFMHFNSSFTDDKGPQRIIGFGLPEGYSKLKQREVTVHLDGTFGCCPKGFYQCLIFSVYIPSDRLFLPVFWVLMSRKSQRSYELAFQMIQSTVGQQLNVEFFMHDFEIAIYNAILNVYPNSTSVGCFFHFKQAIIRRMMKEGIPQHIAFEDSKWFDLLTVVDKNEIFEKAVPYLEFMILERYSDKMDADMANAFRRVFDYIKKHWDNPKMISLFNYTGKMKTL